MITRDRRLLEQIVKQWAQDHDHGFQIADYDSGDEPLKKTGSHFTWLVQEQSVSIDLLGLVDRLEIFWENRRQRKHPDGMICSKCKSFYQFAESNQSDGTLICYSCRNNPYR